MGWFVWLLPFVYSIFGIDDVAIAMVGSAILGGAASAQANDANRKLAHQGMDMSSTAYQRAVADMKAAGLNPMLAYSQGGAASMMPPASQQPLITPAGARDVIQGIQGVRQSMAETDKLKTDTELSKATTGRENAQKNLLNSQSAQTDFQTLLDMGYRRDKLGSEVSSAASKSLQDQFDANIRIRQSDMDGERKLAEMELQQKAVNLKTSAYGVSRARAHAGMYDAPGGEYVPYYESMNPVSASAFAARRAVQGPGGVQAPGAPMYDDFGR